MKMLTLVCIIAVSAVATAQTATNTATTNSNIKTVVSKTKKVKKIKPQASVTTVDKITSETPVNSTSAMTAQATGTSTMQTTTQASVKNWNLSITSDTSIDQTNIDAVQSTTTIGGTYDIGATTLGLAQAFDSATKEAYFFAQPELEENNFRPMFVEPTIRHVVKGFLGSEQTSFSGKVRFYNDNSILNSVVLNKSMDKHYQIAATSAYMLTPQLAFTMHNEARILQFVDTKATASTRLSFIPGLAYNFVDNFSVYQLAGLVVRTKDGEQLRRQSENAYIETGIEYSPKAINGLSVNLLVFQDKLVSSSQGAQVTNLSLYSANDANGFIYGNDVVSYEAIIKYTY